MAWIGTALDRFMFSNYSRFVVEEEAPPAGTSDYLLLESSDYLVAETGDFLMTEGA